MSSTRNSLPFVLAVFLTLIGWSDWSPLNAQTTQLRGRILDNTGRVVPGVPLELTNLSTRTLYLQESDESGRYQFLLLPPGAFSLTARQPGFKEQRVEPLRLEVDSPLVLDVTLEIGNVEESVTVVGSQPMLNKADATLGNPMTPEQILGIPLNARNLAAAVTLQPAVTQSGAVSGARAEQTNLTLDGVDVNDLYYPGDPNRTAIFEPVLRVTPDSVQEFRVVTSNPGASQGRSSGAQVSLITRSGTNQWHGAVYEYHRNAATAANNFFNNRIVGDPDLDGDPGIARPNLIRNVYGGRIGGPLIRDRAFLFFNYEGRKDRSEITSIQTVPLPHMGEGKMRYRGTVGQPIELGPDDFASLYPMAGGLNPAAVRVFAEAARRYPANDTGVGDQVNTGGFRFNAPLPANWNTFISKFDLNPWDGHSLFLRGNFQWDQDAIDAMWPDSPPPATWYHPIGTAVGHSWTIRPDLVNSFRYGFTRQAWSAFEDEDADAIVFREVFQRRWYAMQWNVLSGTHNLTEDLSWVRGRHTLQFGTNIRAISRFNADSQYSFDSASTNYVFYEPSSLEDPLMNAGLMCSKSETALFKRAASNLLGRFTNLASRYLYDGDGNLLQAGALKERTLATREFDFYFEDSWQLASRLTLNLGIRWGVNTPLEETSGFQVQPTVSLSRYFEERRASAARGVPYNDTIWIDRSGPYYDRPGYYRTDWNNLAPRISFAYSPNLGGGLAGKIFGRGTNSVLRGGFAVQYDRTGSFLLVVVPYNSSLGFQVVDNQSGYRNVTDKLGPSFTGYDQDIRTLMPSPPPETLTFPRAQPADRSMRFEGSLDDSIIAPIHYNWNLSFGRELPSGLFIEVSYLGRAARNLLAGRDVVQYNNLVDPGSGMDWYGAAALLYQHRINNTPISEMPAIPYFENLFPDLPGDLALTPTQRIFYIVSREGKDNYSWVEIQQGLLNTNGIFPDMFAQPQYQTLATYSNVARSNYNAFTATIRKRFAGSLTFDVNYTWSMSRDNASGAQTEGALGYTVMVKDAFEPDEQYAVSDFHLQHMVNANWLWTLPFGRGQQWFSGIPGAADALLGGWSLNGIFRWNSGLPFLSPLEDYRFATTRMYMATGTRVRDPKPSPHKDGENPNYWADPQYAYNSFRDALAGEVGERNILRLPGYFALDLGLNKSFRMPWSEGHRLTFACEVFNVTNTQRLGDVGGYNWLLGNDVQWAEVYPGFGNMVGIQGRPREMQFSLRYDF